jgi:hypothetical protein
MRKQNITPVCVVMLDAPTFVDTLATLGESWPGPSLYHPGSLIGTRQNWDHDDKIAQIVNRAVVYGFDLWQWAFVTQPDHAAYVMRDLVSNEAARSNPIYLSAETGTAPVCR